MNLANMGATYDLGDLVKIRYNYGTNLVYSKYSGDCVQWATGVVVDYFPSNVYEPASYIVLYEGQMIDVSALDVFSSD